MNFFEQGPHAIASRPRRLRPAGASRPHRGAILLLVLSMLTLFLMTGILLLVMATRTRATARAFSEATNTTSHGAIMQRALLDEALLRLLRGPTGGAISETILEDKYGGDTLRGQLVAYTGTDNALIDAQITGIPTANPLNLSGRIVTFRPRADDDARVSSYRIVRVFAGTNRFLIANLQPGRSSALPNASRLPCEAFINGREFTALQSDAKNEPYDAYGSAGPQETDAWLTQLSITNSSVLAADPAFGDANTVNADNDNDGIPDGVWLEGMFPDSTAADGGSLRHAVSYLVLDLDGRLNVNAHGAYSPQVYRDAWTGGAPPLGASPGLGAGPADVDASILAPMVIEKPDPKKDEWFLEPAAWSFGRISNRWHRLLAGTMTLQEKSNLIHPYEGPYDPLVQTGNRQTTDIAYAALPEQRRPRQFLQSTTLAGRYGEDRFPGTQPRNGLLPLGGVAGSNTWLSNATLNQFTSRSDQSRVFPIGDDRNVETWRVAGNSPLDLQGRLLAATTGGGPVPSLTFDAPSWQNVGAAPLERVALRSRGFEPTDFYGPIQTLVDCPPATLPIPPLTFDCEYAVLDLVNDPYELDLGSDSAAPALARDPNRPDSIFTIAELEAVLRPFDKDSATLPSRLTGLFDDLAQRFRTAITTDSWDTPGLVGIPARKVPFAAQNWSYSQDELYLRSSPDVAAGLRFDLNRPGMFRVVSIAVKKTMAPTPSGYSGSQVVPLMNDPAYASFPANRTAEIDGFGQPIFELLRQASPVKQWLASSARRLPTSLVPQNLRADYDLYQVAMERPAARQQYFAQLYILLWMLQSVQVNNDVATVRPLTPVQRASIAPYLAQWAANVIEMRDADSTMSRYDYDPDPLNGWGNDPVQTVFGCERPEIVITETLAFDYPAEPVVAPAGTGLCISLFRPWNSLIRHEGKNLATERIDPILAPDLDADSPQANSLHLAKKVANTGTSIWRLRLDGGSQPFVNLGDFASNPNVVVDTNTQLLIGTPQTLPAGKGLPVVIDPAGITAIWLERLADPNRDFNQATNPYIAVDRAPLTLNQAPAVADPAQAKSNRRNASFWKNEFEQAVTGTQLPAPAQRGSWFHWPNRDFVGHAELMLVPTADGSPNPTEPRWQAPLRSLQAYSPQAPRSLAAPQGVINGALVTLPELLDATIVPSRFIGTAVTVSNPSQLLANTSFTEIPCNQLSLWREPGRINFNTVVDGGNNVPSQEALALQRRKRSLVETSATSYTLQPPHQAVNAPTPRSIDNLVQQAFRNPAPKPGPWQSNSELLLAMAHPPFGAAPLPPPVPPPGGDVVSLAQAIRASNAATVRSHMFAVWISIKTENTMTGDARTRRVFAIIDRSIPVGFVPGVDLNVADTIRLKRFLD